MEQAVARKGVHGRMRGHLALAEAARPWRAWCSGKPGRSGARLHRGFMGDGKAPAQKWDMEAYGFFSGRLIGGGGAHAGSRTGV